MRVLSLCCLSSFLIFSCSDDPLGAGEGCELGGGDNGGCQSNLVCDANSDGAAVCQIPLEGTCSLEAEVSHCVTGAACFEFQETNEDGEEVAVGRCYLALHTTCDPIEEVQCAPALQCAPLAAGGHQCELPVAFRGMVVDSADGSAIEGAHVIALDETPTAVTNVAISEADGSYRLDLPVLRDEQGEPMLGDNTFTLRASADGYLTFPGGLRQALPVDSELAMMTADEGWFIEGTLAEVRLVGVEDPNAPRVSISGHVVVDPMNQVAEEAGVLVVANPSEGSGAQSAITSITGRYTIFNVTPGSYEVRGYRSGLQFTPASVTADASDLVDVDLIKNDSALNTLSGTMQIVGSGKCVASSIVLAVESTFDEVLGRGELPATLRAPELPEPPNLAAGESWTINNIPDGRYVVLAGFENDDCVRDPSAIGGTAVVHVELPADAGAIEQSFKVTSAIPTISPGMTDPESVTDPVTLQWGGTSSDSQALVEVFNAYGDNVFSMMVPATNDTVESLSYTGPLESGMYYQFRVTSLGNTGSPLQRTEDLRGVFFVP